MENIIFHIDVNSAFLSWEAVYRLAHGAFTETAGQPTGCHITYRGGMDLREVPSAVGGDVTKRHGIILAKSIPAKKYGIRTGETILEARRKCPNLLLVPPNYDLYRECSAAFLDILGEYSDTVEPYSIDEAFVDMTTTCHLFGTPVETATLIKDRIREELGFTVNIGISHSKLLAKMASDFRKPDCVHTLYREEIPGKMWPLPMSDLFFVGPATAKKLFSMGLSTIGDLAAADLAWLKAVLKKQGETLWGFANGIDLSPVLASPAPNKGYGNSTTTPFDVTDTETANLVLLALLQSGAALPPEITAALEPLADVPVSAFLWAGFERVGAITLHMACSVLVFAAAAGRGRRWLFPAAVLLHFAADFVTVIAGARLPIAATELLVALCALLAAVLAARVYKNLEENPEMT